jgi:hypothetical protein
MIRGEKKTEKWTKLRKLIEKIKPRKINPIN